MGAGLFHADGRTDEKNEVQTDMAELIVAFRNSVKAPDKLWPSPHLFLSSICNKVPDERTH